MANATKRGPGRWLGRYRDRSGRERTKTLPTRAEALAWAQEQERKIRRGEWTDPAQGRVTVGELAEPWLATLNVKPKTRLSYESHLRLHVLPHWGGVRLDRITQSAVRAWITSLPLGPSGARGAYYVLASILDLAVEDGRIARNPARPSGRSKGLLPRVTTTKEHRYLTHEQVARLADEIGPYRPMILLMAYAGLRWGEVAALRVCDIDLLRNRVAVTRTAVEIGSEVQYGTPKTHTQRSIAFPVALRGELEPQLDHKAPEDLLFTSPEGAALRASNFRRRQWNPATARAGLSGVTPHDLRHTAASLAVQAGANVKAVQRMLGHASATMTLDTYAGLFDGDLDEVAARLDQGLSAALADSVRTEDRISVLAEHRQESAHAL